MGWYGASSFPNHGAEGDEPDVAVQRLLRNATRHHHVVVATLLAIPRHHGQQTLQHTGAAHIGAHRQQPDLAQPGIFGRRQILLQVAQFLVKGKGSAVADAHHTHQFALAAADKIGVLPVETVNQGAVVVGGVLWHLFDEGYVVELGDFFKFPILIGLLEHQASAVIAAAAGSVAGGSMFRGSVPVGGHCAVGFRGGVGNWSCRVGHKRFSCNQ